MTGQPLPRPPTFLITDVRTACAPTLLFGLQHTGLLELTVQHVIDGGTAVALDLDGQLLDCRPRLPSRCGPYAGDATKSLDIAEAGDERWRHAAGGDLGRRCRPAL